MQQNPEKINVSVIIPVYGVEKYVERCARSLFEQSLEQGIEFIFVDDYTQDNSIKILNKVLSEYPQRINQIKIISHQHNMGLPQARRTGLSVARGMYIHHVDSDDWVENDTYKKIHDLIQQEAPDAILFDYYEGNEKSLKKKKGCYNTESLIKDMLIHKVACSVWNKIFKRSLYENVEFSDANMGEDLFLTYQLISKSRSIKYLPTPLYTYFVDPESMSRSKSISKRITQFCQLKNNTEKLECLIKRDGLLTDLKPYFDIQKMHTRNTLLPLIKDSDYYKLWRSTYPELNTSLIYNQNITLRELFKHLLSITKIYPLLMHWQ